MYACSLLIVIESNITQPILTAIMSEIVPKDRYLLENSTECFKREIPFFGSFAYTNHDKSLLIQNSLQLTENTGDSHLVNITLCLIEIGIIYGNIQIHNSPTHNRTTYHRQKL